MPLVTIVIAGLAVKLGEGSSLKGPCYKNRFHVTQSRDGSDIQSDITVRIFPFINCKQIMSRITSSCMIACVVSMLCVAE
jgi:hypothetical protein